MSNPDSPLTVLVEYQIRAENTDMAAWLDEWSNRAEDALVGEPETFAYAAAINADAPDQVLVFERYANGQSSVQAHVARPAHQVLTDTMGARNMTRRRVMSARFHDVPEFGWWSRAEPVSGTLAGAILVVLGFRFDDADQLSTYLQLAGEHAAYCDEMEPDTLIYSGGMAVADADREVDLRQGDLVFVMACTDMDAVDRHANDPRHLALMPQFEAHGIRVEPTFMRTYRTAGRGFLWRDAN